MRPKPYLTEPQPRRLAPWLLALTGVVAIIAWLAGSRTLWSGPVIAIFGAGLVAHAVDGFRTGRIEIRFAEMRSLDVNRAFSPLLFWLAAVIYLAVGLVVAYIGVMMTIRWWRQ